MGKAIAIFNQKGGVGKTTTNINLAACLAKKGKKILVLDIDPQGNTTSGLGIEKKALKKSSYDLMIEDDINAEDVILKTGVDNLDIIPANVSLSGAEVELAIIRGREKRLKKALNQVKEKYDFIFIDCPPSLGLLTINSLTAVDSVLIPIQCEFYALEGVAQLMNTIEIVRKNLNEKLYVQGVILSMFNTGLVRRNGFKNSQVATIQQRLKEASEAREEEARGGEVRYVGNMPKISKEEVAKMPFDLYREGYEYYLETHAHPNSTFRYTQSSLLDLMRFDATDQIELINQPLLMLAGSKADTRDMTEDDFAKAVNA